MLAADLGCDVLEAVTNLFGIDGELVVDELVFCCPNPRHPDTHPSCSINTTTGLWACWSCGASGDLLSLGTIALRKPYLKVRRLLSPEGTDGRRTILQNRLRALQKPPGAPQARKPEGARPWLPQDAREPHSYRGRCRDLETYMGDRGFSPETLERWGIRYVRVADIRTKKGTAEIRDSIAIPLLDADGVVQAWSYRRTDTSPEWQPRYLDTYEAPLGSYWHGMHLSGSSSEVVVCEGPLDAMRVDSCGYTAFSVMGNQMPEAKVSMLADFRKITLMLDRDAGGVLATRKIGELLWRHTSTYVARYPHCAQGKDPADLSPLDIELAIANRIPWTAWAIRARLAPTTTS